MRRQHRSAPRQPPAARFVQPAVPESADRGSGPLASLDRLLSGPPIAWPRPVDAALRRWAVIGPRVRAALVIGIALLAMAATGRAVAAAESRWGGPPTEVLVATRDLMVGDAPAVAPRRLPPDAVPGDAVASGDLGEGTRIAVAVPAGGVLTRLHIDPAGPSAGLPADQRLLPIPVDPSWGVTAGGRVDVWVGDGRLDGRPPRLVASGRPVVDVRGEEMAQVTALVALDHGDVPAVTVGLTYGSVLLTHAPGQG